MRGLARRTPVHATVTQLGSASGATNGCTAATVCFLAYCAAGSCRLASLPHTRRRDDAFPLTGHPIQLLLISYSAGRHQTAAFDLPISTNPCCVDAQLTSVHNHKFTFHNAPTLSISTQVLSSSETSRNKIEKSTSPKCWDLTFNSKPAPDIISGYVARLLSRRLKTGAPTEWEESKLPRFQNSRG